MTRLDGGFGTAAAVKMCRSMIVQRLEATVRRQDWVAKLQLAKHFWPTGPATYREVLAALR
jgi:hypothetical protein